MASTSTSGRIADNMFEAVGNTPLIKLGNLTDLLGLEGDIYIKYEACNPAGSVKDRPAARIIKDLLDSGKFNRETDFIVEASSGNTAIGLAAVSASLRIPIVIFMPSTMSIERRLILQSLGAKVILTPGAQGMGGAILAAQLTVDTIKEAHLAGQFDNPSNWKAHYDTTAPEIASALESRNLTWGAFVSGVGTGGTITGVGKYLQKHFKNDVEVVAVEPTESAVLSGESAGPHRIQGIGAGFIPRILDVSIIDSVERVSSEDAEKSSLMVTRNEGIMLGISAGAALDAAIRVAKRPEMAGKAVVTVIADASERYFSCPMWKEASVDSETENMILVDADHDDIGKLVRAELKK